MSFYRVVKKRLFSEFFYRKKGLATGGGITVKNRMQVADFGQAKFI
tara:strand:- start:1508 stop:1645 length:138 start_codon:yes stop_codon:yes gene_type:complete